MRNSFEIRNVLLYIDSNHSNSEEEDEEKGNILEIVQKTYKWETITNNNVMIPKISRS